MTLPADLAPLLRPLEDLARRAGAVVMEVYNSDFAVRDKTDSSPVTEADERAEAIILPGLAALTPGVPVVAEESVAAGTIPAIGSGPFWLVDPVDGTKEFIKRNGEFTVNIGLIRDGVPVLGVVLAPARGELWSGTGATAFKEDANGRRPIACRPLPASGAVIMTSRSHREPESLDKWMAQFPGATLGFAGSSLKFCLVAEGAADLYPRFGPTSEWDIAAASAVLMAAGGSVTTFDGLPMAYGKTPKFLNPDFIARGRG
ncbi:3'(2'),5'-bisphosphate nucleotidase CysQ [Paramagnetospirillum magneticum]|uniref:3'(2'),5'-bisphosphate nucleotidase CysQ n=1 Tax=Paramagnetospirillum magneticum (strain ATCC 700264 / AMB-1) TaxID=342108 RepID=Q2W0W3_PARM1|nr:3'(2'),5'-bisphosphate nucleotidase CysQ [Paramagnetospirillum magneticum]BAE52512.1 3'-Phosphoadenosine 5'-phosphosulfate 3'-phosphatase [Paramagnetospirillum magneticum AMB-1]